MSIAFFDVDETLITGKSMFLFLHRYAEEYPLQCGLTAAAIVRQLQALSKAGQPREAINRYYYSLFRHEPRAQVRAVAEALYREGGYGFHREVVAILRQHQARGDDVVFVSGSMTDILWPAMAALGVEHALCSEPVVVDEHYTGELWRTAIGEHKALHAQRYAQERASRWRRAMPLGTISRICRCSRWLATPARSIRARRCWRSRSVGDGRCCGLTAVDGTIAKKGGGATPPLIHTLTGISPGRCRGLYAPSGCARRPRYRRRYAAYTLSRRLYRRRE